MELSGEGGVELVYGGSFRATSQLHDLFDNNASNPRREEVGAIECERDPAAFDSTALKLFRRYDPKGRNFLVTPAGQPAYLKRYGDWDVLVCTLTNLRP